MSPLKLPIHFISLTTTSFRKPLRICDTDVLRRPAPGVLSSVTPPSASGSFKTDPKKMSLTTSHYATVHNAKQMAVSISVPRCLGPLVNYVAGTVWLFDVKTFAVKTYSNLINIIRYAGATLFHSDTNDFGLFSDVGKKCLEHVQNIWFQDSFFLM